MREKNLEPKKSKQKLEVINSGSHTKLYLKERRKKYLLQLKGGRGYTFKDKIKEDQKEYNQNRYPNIIKKCYKEKNIQKHSTETDSE